ncbi:MAG TPA: HD domain-containing phosphohydrolase [Planctomycetota bacterium]|nr:HD domain-containing phosphohydrolase [Planctomycetota bacterium]
MTQALCNTVLMVDDDARLLDGFRRQYHKALQFTTALGGAEGLEAVRSKGPFAVIVSDYQMPNMNGIQFLSKVREIAPDSVRIMLTGNADLQSAVNAVNEGHVFRFLTKPCTPDVFQSMMRAALEQYRLRFAERTLLEDTLKGSLEVMGELLALANPSAFGRAMRLRRYVASIVTQLGLVEPWRFEAAAMLSQIGCVAVPTDVFERVARGEQLSPEQEHMINRHPEVARDLIGRVPRLEIVAEMIAHQNGCGTERIADPDVRLGARILSLAVEFDELLSVGATPEQALESLRRSHGDWESGVIEAFASIAVDRGEARVANLPVRDLHVGMTLDQDIVNTSGTVLMTRGFRLSPGTLERLRNYAQLGGVVEPIRVLIPPPLSNPKSAA